MSLVFHPNGTIEGFNGNSMPSGAVIQAKYAKDTSSQNWQQSGLGAWADLPNLL